MGYLLIYLCREACNNEYRDALKGGPVLLSNSQAGPGRNFSQPRVRLLVHLCKLNDQANMQSNRISTVNYIFLSMRWRETFAGGQR